VLSAINSAFDVHSDDVQDIAMSQARSIGTYSLCTCILTAYCATQPSTPGVVITINDAYNHIHTCLVWVVVLITIYTKVDVIVNLFTFSQITC